jgi:hypothetical protein
MVQLKTQRNDGDVEAFLSTVADLQRQADAREVCALMEEVTGESPQMWGKSIVGFGTMHYKYATGREGDWFRVGFSPRKQALTLYLMDGAEVRPDLLANLGKYTTGKSCLYIKRLDEVDQAVLREIISSSAQETDI